MDEKGPKNNNLKIVHTNEGKPVEPEENNEEPPREINIEDILEGRVEVPEGESRKKLVAFLQREYDLATDEQRKKDIDFAIRQFRS